MSLRPNGTTQFAREELSLYIILECVSKIFSENSVPLKSEKIK
jgi:hypothetical protein